MASDRDAEGPRRCGPESEKARIGTPSFFWQAIHLREWPLPWFEF